MTIDAKAPCDTGPQATMTLTMLAKQFLVLSYHNKEPPAQSQSPEMMTMKKDIFPQNNDGHIKLFFLTHKQLEMYRCTICTVATDALGQAISIHSTD